MCCQFCAPLAATASRSIWSSAALHRCLTARAAGGCCLAGACRCGGSIARKAPPCMCALAGRSSPCMDVADVLGTAQTGIIFLGVRIWNV